MSSSPAISNDKETQAERRSFPRRMLTHYVVLAFFGEENWGKLTNLSEGGVAFEFSRPPSSGKRIDFTFQVMGCIPTPRDGSALGESFEASGEVVWQREFERTAGVQFVDLAEKNRDQIRQWQSLEASANSLTAEEEAKLEEDLTSPDLPAPLARVKPVPEILGTIDVEQSQSEFGSPEWPGEAVTGPETSATVPEEMPETFVFSDRGRAAEWQPLPELSSRTHAPVARLTFVVVSGCLAAFAVTAGVRIFMARSAHWAGAAERAEAPATVAAQPGSEVSVPPTTTPGDYSPVSPPASSTSSVAPSPESAPPFQVEVLDANGKRWKLWFVHGGSGNGNDQSVLKPTPSPTPSAAKSVRHRETIPAEKPSTPPTFTLVAPNLNRHSSPGSAAGNLSAEAPAIQGELSAQRDPMGGLLNSRALPPPPEKKPVGGLVQQARLVKSIPPVYPSLAKSLHISGDVVVDALIDARGNVKSVKVISGPDLLRQAAIGTVRQWKYEPARLDGQAVAMHLEVTVKFRLN